MDGRSFHFSIDRGGTFTDVFAEVRGAGLLGRSACLITF